MNRYTRDRITSADILNTFLNILFTVVTLAMFFLVAVTLASCSTGEQRSDRHAVCELTVAPEFDMDSEFGKFMLKTGQNVCRERYHSRPCLNEMRLKGDGRVLFTCGEKTYVN